MHIHILRTKRIKVKYFLKGEKHRLRVDAFRGGGIYDKRVYDSEVFPLTLQIYYTTLFVKLQAFFKIFLITF